MKSMKRISAVLLAMLLSMTVATSAFAAEPTAVPEAEEIEQAIEEPTAEPSSEPEASPSFAPEDIVKPQETINDPPIQEESAAPEAVVCDVEHIGDDSESKEISLPGKDETRAILDKIAAYELKTVTNPTFGTSYGEWTVLALARYGSIPDKFKQTYLGNLYSVTENKKGILDKKTYTEYSRVIVALSSLGMDARDVAGYDLVAPLADFDQVNWQGVNGPIWALIALDTLDYEVPQLPTGSGKTQTTREKLIGAILGKEITGGGWSIMGGGSRPEADITGMGIQALAPYYNKNTGVKSAVDRALAVLSTMQLSQGGFGSCESDAQVIVALNALDIPLNDPSFVKNGKTVLDDMMIYYIESEGSFCHTIGDGANPMATDQAMYALVSYYRSITGQNKLYDMSDARPKPPAPDEEKAEREAVIAGINTLPAVLGIKDKANVSALSVRLNKLSFFDGKAGYETKIRNAKEMIAAIEKRVEQLDNDIWNRLDPQNITQKDAGTVSELLAVYNEITAADREYLNHSQDLIDAQAIIDALNRKVIPKKVFENLNGFDKIYTYSGEANGFGYVISISGKKIMTPDDMDVSMTIGEADAGKIKSVMKDAYWMTLGKECALPAEVSLRANIGAKDGDYTLYRYIKTGNELQKLGNATVENGQLVFDTDKGGIYLLMPESAPKTLGKEKNIAAGTTIKKDVFKEIKGKDVNLKIEGEAEDGISYAMIFNGQDVKTPMDFDSTMTLKSAHETSIRQLAEAPFILHFNHSGALPGKMLVEVGGVKLSDGEYLLFYYNEAEQKAEVVQKVNVKDGSTKFFLEHCSDYFIAKRAKKASIAELNAPVVLTEQSPNEPDKAESRPYDTHSDTPQDDFPWAVVIIAVVAAGAVGAWFIVRAVKKGKKA